MKESASNSLLILGRQPELGLAELESLYGARALRKVGQGAVELNMEAAAVDFSRLGGTIKLARLLSKLDDHDWPNLENYLISEVPKQLAHQPEGKFNLGVSVYGINLAPKVLNQSLMKLKSAIKASGRSVRIIPNKESALNSAQVIHNKLVGPRGWELIILRDGQQTLIAQTVKVQDIAAYASRDQARPKRDAKIGMLPPKLAQTIINLAKPPRRASLVDPFCGTGVIMQEGLLMGYDVVGTDIDQRMIDFSRENLDWLRALQPEISALSQLEPGDATKYTWPAPIGAVASETYLGRALPSLPAPKELEKIIQDVNTILTKFLHNLAPQLQTGTKLCLAVPAWRDGQKFIKLPLVAKITDMGYNFRQFQHADAGDLIYHREGQIVGRQLLALERI